MLNSLNFLFLVFKLYIYKNKEIYLFIEYKIINLLKDLVFIQLFLNVIICIKLIFVNENIFPKNYMKILFQNKL